MTFLMLKKYVCKQGNQIARLSWLTDNVNFKLKKIYKIQNRELKVKAKLMKS